MTEPPRTERREVHYSGHVQGVGFRFTVQNIAQQFSVTGFVRNLPDGRVHLVAEGEPSELDGFLDEVDARMRDHINSNNTKRDVLAVSGEFARFSIRH